MPSKLKLWPMLFLVVVLAIAIPASPRQMTAAQGTFDGLDLLIGIDVSGSMYATISDVIKQTSQDNRVISSATDWGDSELFRFTNSLVARTATDPTGLRFEAVSFALDWLARTSATYQFQTNVSLVAFATKTDILSDWRDLTAAQHTGTGQTQTMTPTAVSSGSPINLFNLSDPYRNDKGYRNSNIRQLYRTARQEFDKLPHDNHKRVLVIITDSAQCDPINDAPCTATSTIANALSSVISTESPAGVEQVVFYLGPTTENLQGPTLYVTKAVKDYDSVKSAWARVRGKAQNLDRVEDLPAELFEAVVNQVASVRSVAATDIKQLGIGQATAGLITVPPFQSDMEIVAFAASTDHELALQVQGPSGSPPPQAVPYQGQFVSVSGRVRVFNFVTPTPGAWHVSANGTDQPTVWASFTSATPRLRIDPANIVQYQPFRIVYELLDSAQKPLINSPTSPSFKLTLEQEGKSYDLDLYPTGSAYVSDLFYPVSTAPIRANFRAEPGPLTNAFTDFKFLIPSPLPDITPAPVTFVPVFGTTEQIAAAKQTGNIITMPRSEILPVTVTLSEGAIPKEAQFTLHLEDVPNATADNPCPLRGVQPMESDAGRTTMRANLHFDKAGECIALLNVNLEKVALAPLSNAIMPIFPEKQIGRVRVTSTRRLALNLLDSDKKPITVSALTPQSPANFSMPDLQPIPHFGQNGQLVSWDPVQMNIEAVFVDAENQAEQANPVFETTAGSGPNADCNPDNVPLTLSVTQVNGDGTNLAQRLGLAWCKSANAGFYVLPLQGLTPGEYDLTLGINRARKLNLQVNEYAVPFADPGFVRRARVHVDATFVVRVQFYGTLAILVLFALWILLWVRRRIVVYRSHLRGDVALYVEQLELDTQTGHVKSNCHEVWRARIPENTTRYRFPPGEFVVDELVKYFPVADIEVSTHQQAKISRREAAFVTLLCRDTTILDDKLLEPGERVELEEQTVAGKPDRRKFWFVKLKRNQAIF